MSGRSCSLWVTRALGLVFLLVAIGLFYWLSMSSAQAAAGINRQISYQGKLLNAAGMAVTDGTYQMKFSLYSASSGGTTLWTASGTTALPTAIPVAVQDGLFSLLLGDSSAEGFWQNTLDSVNWNTDALYLGVTIASDSEMSPRKRLGAVPQAFNAEQLQGMYASSTASGGQNLFTVNQTENNAATSSRTALLVRSNGTSNQNDFLLRGVNDQDTTVFSLNRQGSVTSSGSFYYGGNGTSTLSGSLSVGGNTSSSRLTVDQGLTVYGNTSLGAGSAQTVTVSGRFNSSLLPSVDASWGLGSTSLRWLDGNFVSVSSTYATSTFLYAQYASSLYATSTNFFADRAVFTNATATNFSADYILAGRVSSSQAFSRTAQGDSLDVTVRVTSTIPLVHSQHLSGTVGRIYVGGHYAVATHVATDQFTLFDITSSTRPVSLGIQSFSDGGLTHLALEENYMFSSFSGTSKLYITDMKGGALTTVGSITLASVPRWFSVQGRYVYVFNDDEKLRIVDISNPRLPILINTFTPASAGTARRIVVRGKYAYLQFDLLARVEVVDISDPYNPTTLTSTTTVEPDEMLQEGSYLYTAGSALKVTNVRNPSSLVYGGELLGAGTISSFVKSGRYIFAVVTGSGLKVIDAYNASQLSILQSLGGFTLSPMGVAINGRALYVTDAITDNFLVYQLPGIDVTSLDAAIANVGTLSVMSDGRVGHSFEVGDQLTVGQGGIRSDGPLGIGSYSTSTFTGHLSVSGTTQLGLTQISGTSVQLLVNTSSSSPIAKFTNTADYNVQHAAWGAYVDRLLVGPNAAATGTRNYSMVLNYGLSGLCLAQDFRNSCPGYTGTHYSLIADDVISSSDAFDLAESYRLQGVATTTDVLVFGTDPVTVQKSSGIPYDPKLVGVYSTKPGFLLGMISDGAPVALTGRVPTQVSPVNGAIAIGDPLTTSEYPGVAMKATKPGMILGYALEATNSTSTIEVFVKTGYSAGTILNTDGRVARLTDDLVVEARAEATAVTPIVDSWGLTFRGSAWDGVQANKASFGLLTEVTTPTSSSFVIRNASSSNVFSINQLGKATIAGDMVVGGRLYPAGRQGVQQSKYIFLDDTSTSTQYIATNADGWQANDSYDFAERYYSPDKLDRGDLVVASERGQFHVQRSLNETGLLMGIVSTKPAFIAGRPDPDTYPIALAGRVPTKVSTMNGAIKIGDPLGPSTIPGTAVKATKAGPIVGLALESYDGAGVGKIEVFVNPGWWGGPQKEASGVSNQASDQPVKTDHVAKEVSYRGFAYVEAGSKQVHVAYDSVLSYPNIQVTPRGQVNGGWWTDNYTDIGFDIFLHDKQMRDVTFAWSVQGTPTGARVYRSDGTYALVNTTTGEALIQTVATSTQPTVPEPQEQQPVTPPVTQDVPTSTEPIISVTDPVASSTEPVVPIVVEEPAPVVVEPVVPVEEPSVNLEVAQGGTEGE
ncbi:hypothetical protein KBD61_02495 [Patescibacteria group bacterium]|nr:hypothetical protein [Patescibacteria group bacterium]